MEGLDAGNGGSGSADAGPSQAARGCDGLDAARLRRAARKADLVPVNLFDLDNEIKNVSRLKGKVAMVVTKGAPTRNAAALFIHFGDFLRRPAGRVSR